MMDRYLIIGSTFFALAIIAVVGLIIFIDYTTQKQIRLLNDRLENIEYAKDREE
jgi:hypothetical protein